MPELFPFANSVGPVVNGCAPFDAFTVYTPANASASFLVSTGKILSQLPMALLFGIYPLVHSFVAGPHPGIARVIDGEPATDLFGSPPITQATDGVVYQLVVLHPVWPM